MKRAMLRSFPKGRFRVIYGDPAWPYKNLRTGGSLKSGAAQQYEVMSIEDIKALPVKDISMDPSVLFLWVTFPLLKEGLEVMEAWGFRYYSLGFSWLKINKTRPGYAFGMGNFTRGNCEICLLGIRGNFPKSMIKSRSVSSVIVAPRTAHSAKPPEVRERIVQLLGNVPRVELFCRGPAAPGWVTWGNQAVQN